MSPNPNKKECKVSIVIPCYNDYYIQEAVNSAYNQTYKKKEIIVVDDGSNQNTKKIIEKVGDKINRLITQENSGVIAARNRGIEIAKGEYILTLDSDDTFDPKFLEKAVEILNNESEVGMVTCWFTVWDEDGTFLRIDKPTGGSAFDALFYNNATASLLFRKQCWIEVDGYDPYFKNGYEDWDFNIAVSGKGWGIKVIPESLFNYRKKKESRNKSAKTYYPEIRRFMYKKHQDLLIKNIDTTIDFFLDEIENKNKNITQLRNSSSYKIWSKWIKPIRKKLKF